MLEEPETITSLREFVGKTVASIQRDSAGMYAAAAAARDLGQTQRALFGQDRAARLHNEAAEWLDWLADDVFMHEWCDNINRGHYEDERERLRRQPTAGQPDDGSSVSFQINGLRARDVS